MKHTNLNKNIARYLSVGGFLAIASLAAAPPAHATPILDGNSNSSTFSNLSCTTSCPDSSLTSNAVTLGSNANGGGDSILSINSLSFSTDSDTTLNLAELTLEIGNKPGAGQSNVTFQYNLVLTLLIPSGVGPSQTFSAGLVGDLGAGANGAVTLSGLSLTLMDPLALSGVTLSNFQFVSDLVDSFSATTNTWTVPGPKSAHLFLVADVAATTISNPEPDPDPVSVPEPSTLALLSLGLAGLGFSRRKMKA